MSIAAIIVTEPGYSMLSDPAVDLMIACGVTLSAIGIFIILILIKVALSQANRVLEITKIYLRLANSQNSTIHKSIIMLSGASEGEKKKAIKELDDMDLHLSRGIESL